ncbi:MAG: peptidoglycan-binding protein [Xanthomonadaceae bacterium]|jgi:peptidoglycan hydrolase-like protein with peptidoglycan-binding domain|nr:peptidoglycan-binding protein [Xanthomonadaceae bacterium]
MPDNTSWRLGQTSASYESSGNPGTISTGKGDHGGVSYGMYQFASKTGGVQEYLKHSSYSKQFDGLQPATAAFDAKWRSLAEKDPGFAKDQHDFIQSKYYDVQNARLKAMGIDLSSRGPAVQDALWSTSVQFRGLTPDIFHKGMQEKFGRDYQLSDLSDRDIVQSVQDYKIAHNQTLFKSSPTWWNNLESRAYREKADLVAMAEGYDRVPHGTSTPPYRTDARGQGVANLQNDLNRLGFTNNAGKALTTDGQFGNNTREAIQHYQQNRGLPETGTADKATLVSIEQAVRALDCNQSIDNPKTQQPAESPPRVPQSVSDDDTLRHGQRSAEVKQLQEALHGLGYRDKEDKPLSTDGIYGDRTKQAVEAFQHAHGMPVNGAADPATLSAIAHSRQVQAQHIDAVKQDQDSVNRDAASAPSQAAPSVSDPSHPQHALFQQSYDGLKKLDPARLGFTSEQQYLNAAGTAAFEASVSGLKQIDHIAVNRDGTGLTAVQGALDDPGHQRVYMDKNQAAAQPLEHSSSLLREEMQQQRQQAQTHQAQKQSTPGLSM